MFKKIVAVLLSLVLLGAFAACNKDKVDTDEVVPSEKKVAVIVAPQAQYPEEYLAAQALAKDYSNVVVKVLEGDTRVLKAGNMEVMTVAEELAKDAEIGAIIFDRTIQQSYNAIQLAKAANPEIVTICIEPEDQLGRVAALANAVFCVDWQLAANDIVAKAKSLGAEYFVCFANNRYLQNELDSDAVGYFEAACAEQGVTYVYDNAYDTNSSGGFSKAQLYIKEADARLIQNNKIAGTNVCYFSFDSAIQTTLIELANAKGYIYVAPSFPTAYNGICEAYSVDVNTDAKDIVTACQTAAEGAKGKFAYYNYTLGTTLLRAALYTAYDILNGTTTADNIAEKGVMRLYVDDNSDELKGAVYSDVFTNVIKAYKSAF